ncbi:hypothetical protein BDP27DRAFT_1517384 [Rhodocollybia butyracea]|uniref:Mitochondrial inner membrane protease ATP23 n=1 Tax=Rhodocollybia butyracea TaxID=206335 RepID=A0A9P5TXS3_9AGAR|nr:hypothetical protein BDP27DRAFT_1517384 [Rhodocollybia butyracea]
MFDEFRFKVDWNNLRHHACSEIHVSNLSGDTRELRRVCELHETASGLHLPSCHRLCCG